MNQQYLAHWGILGMHWGKRKGSSGGASISATPKKATPQSTPKPHDFNKTKTKIDAASSIVGESKKIEGVVTESRNKKIRSVRPDTSFMSDDDLKKAVSRMTMEKQYATLQAEQMMSGKNHVKSILETTGTVMAVASSAVAILAAIDKMAGDKPKPKVA